MQNPLFPPTNDSPDNTQPVQPDPAAVPAFNIAEDREAAANLIRQKLAAIYGEEPSAKQEIKEVEQAATPLSKHQLFMRHLQASGSSLAEIQTAWHEYYMGLPDEEKHEVWREFYAANSSSTPFQQHLQNYDQAAAAQNAAADTAVEQPNEVKPQVIAANFSPAKPQAYERPRLRRPSTTDIRRKIRSTVSANGKLTARSHFQSLGFGLATGAIVVFIFLFGFFNQVLITPFIQPPRQANETPVIVNTASAPVSSTPEVIIPKINVEIPTDYSVTSTDEAGIENALEGGVVHYPTTVMPGQTGNTAFFGHSSNNIFNPGKYKFAFVLLHKLTAGDIFYLTYQGKTYAYEVISRQIVEPTDIAVLGPVEGQTATATLITCDPPGTSLHRLVVVGKQISPDPGGNATPAQPEPSLASATPATELPGNGPSLWSRMWHAIF